MILRYLCNLILYFKEINNNYVMHISFNYMLVTWFNPIIFTMKNNILVLHSTMLFCSRKPNNLYVVYIYRHAIKTLKFSLYVLVCCFFQWQFKWWSWDFCGVKEDLLGWFSVFRYVDSKTCIFQMLLVNMKIFICYALFCRSKETLKVSRSILVLRLKL